MDIDAPILFSSVFVDVLWRRALRNRGWSKERIRQLERRMSLIAATTLILGFIALTASLS